MVKSTRCLTLRSIVSTGQPFLKSAGALLLFLLTLSPAAAEVLTITATGEYRLAGQDTSDEGKRRARQEANRLALERMWSHLLELPEIKSLGIGRKDIQDYTRGLIELTEETARSQPEEKDATVRVDTTARIDKALLLRRINAARQSQSVGD